MIRIDEIYNNTFWPWIQRHRPGMRLFFCDPFGRTDPDALFNHGCDDIIENDYVFFHDQEPVHLDLHQPLFNEVCDRSLDIFQRNAHPDWQGDSLDKYVSWLNLQHRSFPTGANGVGLQHVDPLPISNLISTGSLKNRTGHVVVSEEGEQVERLAHMYGWKTHYYFFHGWACLDWFRGYDKTFLIDRASERHPTKTFMSPNRIIGGKRDHRILFLYNVFRHRLEHNWISAPRICTYENVDIAEISKKYSNTYADIEQVFLQAPLPKLFPGEDSQIMTSYWLTNFREAADSLVYVPTETVYFGRRSHITEKTFKAIVLEMPFVLMAPAGSLEYMRRYGFQTFSPVLDESYDTETDDILRIEKVVKLLRDLDDLSIKERQHLHRAMLPMVQHNYNHFYGTGFSDILWQELTHMLDGF